MINYSMDYDPVLMLSAILRKSATQIATPHGFVAFINEGQASLTIEYGIGLGENYVGRILQLNEGATGKVFMTGEPTIVSNYDKWDGQFRGILPRNKAQIGTVLATPVCVAGRVTAVIVFVLESEDLRSEAEKMAWLHQVSESASGALVKMEVPQIPVVTPPPTPSQTGSFPLLSSAMLLIGNILHWGMLQLTSLLLIA